jgi:hypothetical protein
LGMHFWKSIGQVGFKISHEANKGEPRPYIVPWKFLVSLCCISDIQDMILFFFSMVWTQQSFEYGGIKKEAKKFFTGIGVPLQEQNRIRSFIQVWIGVSWFFFARKNDSNSYT